MRQEHTIKDEAWGLFETSTLIDQRLDKHSLFCIL